MSKNNSTQITKSAIKERNQLMKKQSERLNLFLPIEKQYGRNHASSSSVNESAGAQTVQRDCHGGADRQVVHPDHEGR
jgi:MOSC domain-containing protein YiiM